MLRLRLVCPLAVMALAACQTLPNRPGSPEPQVVMEEVEAWREVAVPADAARLDGIGLRWEQALAAARRAGLSRRISAEGALLDPSAGLERAAPAPGTYSCRYVRLGGRRWAASPSGFCYVGVQERQLSLATELRGLRVGGYLWEPREGDRLVFLGAGVPPGARTPAAYGADPVRDSAGLFDRIGDFRYRLILPEPLPATGLTIVELVAAPQD